MKRHLLERHPPAEGMRYSLKADRYSSHSRIAAWLISHKAQTMPDRKCVVYDIGCAQGILGQLLDPNDFWMFGVDSEWAALAQARLIYQAVMHADIENRPTFGFPEPPDVMVLADVLEHTREPAQCLGWLCHTYLAPRTPVVISLPNVAHAYLRLSLLAGRFEYTERGLLDRTHLRFFTLASALRLVRSCGIEVNRVAATPVPLPLVNSLFEEGRPLWLLHRLNAACARLFKTLLAYQVIVYGTYHP
jgi:2-polyprenyl-3-methyl-5-hydroxy-6-metoxy-1,4-benzoquinol methylase